MQMFSSHITPQRTIFIALMVALFIVLISESNVSAAGEEIQIVTTSEDVAFPDRVHLSVTAEGDAEIVQEASGTLLVKGEGATTLALDTELDEELLDEGIARELVNRVQRLRKDSGLEITDRIELGIAGAPGLQDATISHRDFISGETLALKLVVDSKIDGEKFAHLREVEIDDMLVQIGLSMVTK